MELNTTFQLLLHDVSIISVFQPEDLGKHPFKQTPAGNLHVIRLRVMLAKTEERKPGKGGEKKRRHPDDDGLGGEKKRREGEEGEKKKDGGRKRLDAMSVGYFRRVGERLSEGFADDEERGEIFLHKI